VQQQAQQKAKDCGLLIQHSSYFPNQLDLLRELEIMSPSAPQLSNPSESDIYDRQIRLWGADAQVI
jgi:hypothetical protein